MSSGTVGGRLVPAAVQQNGDRTVERRDQGLQRFLEARRRGGDRLADAHEGDAVALASFLADRVVCLGRARLHELLDWRLGRGRRLLLRRHRNFLQGGIGRFQQARATRRLVAFLARHLEHRRQHALAGGEQSGHDRGHFAIGAVVDIDQRPLHPRHALGLFGFLLLQALQLFVAQRHARHHPAQGRRHRHGGDHGHGDDHRVELVAERAHRQADRGDDDLGRAAGIEPGGERQRFQPVEAAQQAAGQCAQELADAGDQDDGGGEHRAASDRAACAGPCRARPRRRTPG